MRDAAFHLDKIAALSAGHPDVVIGLIDGPVRLSHPDLGAAVKLLGNPAAAATSSPAGQHGTFIAGILAARSDTLAPGICPDCTLLVRVLEGISVQQNGILSLSQDELAAAIVDCVEHGANLINLSLSMAPRVRVHRPVVADALRLAASRGVLVIAASGNQAMLHDSEITAHPWVIPVTSLGADGRASIFATTSPSVGARGVSAPGEDIRGLDEQGGHITLSGTSAAAAFVTGAAALLRTLFNKASPQVLRAAIAPAARRRRTLYPLPFDVWAAYQRLAQTSPPAPAAVSRHAAAHH